MEFAGRAPAAPALAAAAHVLQAPPAGMLPRLSLALSGAVPHLAAAELTAHDTGSPFLSTGETDPAGRITAAELTALLGSVTAGLPWRGVARIGGADRPVLAVVSDYTPKGALLVLVRATEGPLTPEITETVQAFWDLITSHRDRLVTESLPGAFAQSRVALRARAGAVTELGETHAATLAGLLGVLRSRRLDDAAARAAAVDLAVTALVELRARTKRDGAASEEPVGQAFERLADSLRPLLRDGPVELELGPPGDEQLVPAEIAHATRAAVRAVVLAVLRQDEVSRIRVGWQVEGGDLRASVRDDGPGALRDDLAVCPIAQRLSGLGGRFFVDAVPGWGMTVTITVPLLMSGAAKSPRAVPGSGGAARLPDPLAGLAPREREVLEHLALGHRNRTIAQQLHIGESTVKFHVTNILTKLEVRSRGEAAALFHTAAA